jgi:hypothetical protein
VGQVQALGVVQCVFTDGRAADLIFFRHQVADLFLQIGFAGAAGTQADHVQRVSAFSRGISGPQYQPIPFFPHDPGLADQLVQLPQVVFALHEVDGPFFPFGGDNPCFGDVGFFLFRLLLSVAFQCFGQPGDGDLQGLRPNLQSFGSFTDQLLDLIVIVQVQTVAQAVQRVGGMGKLYFEGDPKPVGYIGADAAQYADQQFIALINQILGVVGVQACWQRLLF